MKESGRLGGRAPAAPPPMQGVQWTTSGAVNTGVAAKSYLRQPIARMRNAWLYDKNNVRNFLVCCSSILPVKPRHKGMDNI